MAVPAKGSLPPQAIGIGATWDRALIASISEITARPVHGAASWSLQRALLSPAGQTCAALSLR